MRNIYIQCAELYYFYKKCIIKDTTISNYLLLFIYETYILPKIYNAKLWHVIQQKLEFLNLFMEKVLPRKCGCFRFGTE